jgi:hypothetical protein
MRLLLTRHLRTRLALRQTFSFALLVIILAWSAYGLLARHVYGEVDDEVQDRSIAVRTMLQVRDGHVRWLNQEADSEVREQFEHSIRFYQFLDEHGQVLDSSREFSRFQLPLGKQAQNTLHRHHLLRDHSTGQRHQSAHLEFPRAGLKTAVLFVTSGDFAH